MAMEEEDGMDSLFEGMVLFIPSDQFTADDKVEQGKEVEVEQNPPPNHPIPNPIPIPVTDSHLQSDKNDNIHVTAVSVPETASASHHNQLMLDENLFSDLTIQTLNPAPSDPLPTTTATISFSLPPPSITSTTTSNNTAYPTTVTSPHISSSSRKKKRAASVRIGYARDHHPVTTLSSTIDVDAVHDHASQSPLSIANHDGDDHSSWLSDSQSTTSSSKKDDDGSLPKFDFIKSEISRKLKAARRLIAAVSTARKESISVRRTAANQLHMASANQALLELQLEEACEAEDFETAERVSDSLAAAEKGKQSLLHAFNQAEAHCDAIDSQMFLALDSLISAEQESASLLYHFAKDADNHAHLVLKEAEVCSSKEIKDWFSSMEVMEAKKIEWDIESHFISDARLQVNDYIQDSVKEDKKERDVLCEKSNVLACDLQHLLTLVKQKELEIAENDSKIKAVDERIAALLSGFQEIQSGIDAKFDGLQSDLSQMNLQSEALSAKKKEIDKFITEEEDQGAKLKELARLSEDEAKEFQEVVELRKSLKSSILKTIEEKLRLAKTEEKLTEDVQVLQREVSAARGSLQELSSTKSGIQQNMSSFKQRILFIDKSVPELEAEKKVAAAARNFKEAARIAAEAKSFCVEKDGLQIDLEKATSELEKLEEDIKDTVNRLQTTEGLILSKEKEVAMARFQRLLLIAGAARAERLAALELGDFEEVNLLLAEAEAANDEAEKLKPIYNFKEEEFPIPEHSISMELVANLGREQLAEFAASVHFPSSE